MALPSNADVRFLLSRIRPNTEWGWMGGAANDFTLVVWRDAVQIEPLEAEYAAEQVVVDAEEAVIAAERLAQKGRSAVVVGQAVGQLSASQLNAVVEELLVRAGGINPANSEILPVDDWDG